MLFLNSLLHTQHIHHIHHIQHIHHNNIRHGFLRSMVMMKKDLHENIVQKEFRAMNVGLSLNFLTKMATDIRYGKNIVDPELFLLEFLLGYHTYGLDRYKDDGTIDNRQYLYDIAFIIIISIIASKRNLLNALPFEFLIYSTKIGRAHV